MLHLDTQSYAKFDSSAAGKGKKMTNWIILSLIGIMSVAAAHGESRLATHNYDLPGRCNLETVYDNLGSRFFRMPEAQLDDTSPLRYHCTIKGHVFIPAGYTATEGLRVIASGVAFSGGAGQSLQAILSTRLSNNRSNRDAFQLKTSEASPVEREFMLAVTGDTPQGVCSHDVRVSQTVSISLIVNRQRGVELPLLFQIESLVLHPISMEPLNCFEGESNEH